MFVKSAEFYDAIYAGIGKDYAGEAGRVHDLIRQHKRSAGSTLLDVGCGTGSHLVHLRQFYAVEGLDLDAGILDVARRNLPGVPFHQADMADFDLGRQFDAVTCLFSSIGYVKTVPRLQQTLQTFYRHTAPGGLVIVEPWLRPEVFYSGRVHATFIDQPELKIARMNVSQIEDGVSVLDFHYLVATPAGVEHFTERHELALFTDADHRDAILAGGLHIVYDSPEGLTGRGLYIGRKER